MHATYRHPYIGLVLALKTFGGKVTQQILPRIYFDVDSVSKSLSPTVVWEECE